MILEVTNGLKHILIHSSATHKNEAQQLLTLPKKTIQASTSEKSPLQLTDERLPTNAQITFNLKGKKIYLATNIPATEIIRPYPNSIALKAKESYELRKGDILEMFHQAYIFRVISL